MNPDRELLSILYKPAFDDNRGRPPFKLFDDRFMIVELSNTSNKSPSIELEYKLRYSILDTKLQNLFPSSNEIFEFTIVRDVRNVYVQPTEEVEGPQIPNVCHQVEKEVSNHS